MNDERIEVTTDDGEIVGCYVGDRVINPIRGISGTIVGLGDAPNTVRIKVDETGESFDVEASNFQDYWE